MAKLIIKVEIECFITDYLLEKAYFMCVIERFKWIVWDIEYKIVILHSEKCADSTFDINEFLTQWDYFQTYFRKRKMKKK